MEMNELLFELYVMCIWFVYKYIYFLFKVIFQYNYQIFTFPKVVLQFSWPYMIMKPGQQMIFHSKRVNGSK